MLCLFFLFALLEDHGHWQSPRGPLSNNGDCVKICLGPEMCKNEHIIAGSGPFLLDVLPRDRKRLFIRMNNEQSC